jgi:hypothetical protein
MSILDNDNPRQGGAITLDAMRRLDASCLGQDEAACQTHAARGGIAYQNVTTRLYAISGDETRQDAAANRHESALVLTRRHDPMTPDVTRRLDEPNYDEAGSGYT